MSNLRAYIATLPLEQGVNVLTNLKKMPEREQQEFLDLIEEKMSRIKRNAAQGGLLDFVKAVYPNYMVGAHHKRLAKLLEEAIDGDKKRIIVNIAPNSRRVESCKLVYVF